MTTQLRNALLAERSALQKMIESIPDEDVIDRGSLQAKLEQVEIELTRLGEIREPARTKLTFVGRPVIGSHGIFADFGMKAVNGFAEAIAAVAASLTAPLRSMGPIPNRDQNQLLITNTALGSFGFELEELPCAQLKLDEPSIVEQALERTQMLLQAAAESDDEMLADAAAEMDQRALDKVRAFVETLRANEALCAIEFRKNLFRFKNGDQVEQTVARISEANLQETVEELTGSFEGALPNKRRTFEFKVADTDEVIVGRFGAGVERPDEVNRHLFDLCKIKVAVTRVGTRKRRYVLLNLPDWDVANSS